MGYCILNEIRLPIMPDRSIFRIINGTVRLYFVVVSSVREYVFCILCFFQISKKHDFLRFFEMTYQKVVKSR